MSTATGTYFDGEVAKPRLVTLEFSAGLLRIRGDALELDVELAAVRASDRLGELPRFLYLPRGGIVETADNAAIDAALAARGRGRGARLIHALESRQRIAVAACLLLVLAIAGLAWKGPPVLARVVAHRVPDEIDRKIGTAALATIGPYFARSTLTEPERERVRRQLARLRAGAPGPAPRLEFRSMLGGLPNAFALPGGIIVVTDELVRLPATDDEIAAVLAHEIGHLELRHGLQSILRQSFALLIVAAVTGDLTTLTTFAGALPLSILTAGYSRDLEREADRHALALLQARGIKRRAFVAVLEKLEAARQTIRRTSTYLNTHPETEERVGMFGGRTATDRMPLVADPVQRLPTVAVAADLGAAGSPKDRAPTDANGLIARGRGLLERADFAAAEADARRALEMIPAMTGALVLRAEALALEGKDYGAAAAAAQSALEGDPKDAAAAATLGYATLMAGDPRAAAPHLDRAIALAPEDVRGWAYRGYLRARENDLLGALADYDEALSLDRRIEWVRFARGVLRNGRKDFTGALADFSAITTAERRTAEYHLHRGRATLGLRRAQAAIEAFDAGLDEDPAPEVEWELRMLRGTAGLALHRYEDAIEDFNEALELKPDHGPAYMQRGIARRRAERVEEAVADFAKAIETGVAEDSVRKERAMARWALGRYDEAMADFDAALAKGADADVLRDRALLRFALSQWKEAEADLSAMLRLPARSPTEQNYPEMFRLLARRCAGVDERRRTFVATLGTWPAGWSRSVAWFLLGDFPETRLLAEAERGGVPNRSERLCEAYFYIGIGRLIANDRAGAETYFRKCVGTGVTNYYEYKIAQTLLARGWSTG